jgi:ATPase
VDACIERKQDKSAFFQIFFWKSKLFLVYWPWNQKANIYYLLVFCQKFSSIMSTLYTDLLTTLDSFFDEQTMSAHIKAGQDIRVKKWAPGGWVLETTPQQFSAAQIRDLVQKIRSSAQADISEQINPDEPIFAEIQRTYSEVFQCGRYRIVYTKPPVSGADELTIVRPVKQLSLDAYDLDEHLITLITNPHNGILIAGAPGEGKSTFAQAVTAYLSTKNLIIKTIEAPRDLQVAKTITQLSFFHASHQEIRDILLLSRPDITIFDEVRNHDDFHLYKDLRLAGIGMIGVMHATQPIDALQRFLHAVDLWSAAHVITCIVFIKAGQVGQLLTLKQTVKVPLGMMAEDLARPVIEVTDARTWIVTHEVYSYGEQVVVMPTDQLATDIEPSAILKFATEGLQEELQRARKCPVEVVIDSPHKISVTIPKGMKGEVIGRNGETIKKREKKLGCAIHISTDDTMRWGYAPKSQRDESESPPAWKRKPKRRGRR